MIMVLEEKTRPFKKIARNFIAQKNNYWWNYGCLLVRGTCLWLTVAAVLGRLSQLVLDKQRYMWFLVPGHENFVQERLNLCEFSAHWSYLVASRQFLINWLHKLCCFLFVWYEELTHWKRLWCWERLRAGGEGDDPGWDGWMASRTRWTWVWVNSGRWWWTGRPGVLQFMGSQRVRHNWATELNWR